MELSDVRDGRRPGGFTRDEYSMPKREDKVRSRPTVEDKSCRLGSNPLL